MKSLRLLLLFGLLAPTVAAAQATSVTPSRTLCIDRMSERLGALAARDWLSLGRLARRDKRECVGKLDREADTAIFEQVATSALQVQEWANAFEAARDCTAFNYLAFACHLHEVEALIELNRSGEAARRVEVTERLLVHLVNQSKSRAKENLNADEREANEIARELLQIAMERSAFLRAKAVASK